MSDLPRTHWVGDGCVPPHSTEPAVLPPISDSTVTPVASEGTMRLRRERDEARAEVERLTDANERLQGMVEWMFEVIVDARDACQRAERTRLAADLREQAELARTSPNGRHPDLRVMTHAAALLWAADRIDPRWTVGDE